ncbi:hypothetical protein ACTJJ4_03025 [Microbacterium sp. 22195]|uniref:hypothetical protein n=1 Tax=Microbacterium sp. 22195 TaxID=3453891 RepID=UPI003F86831C
MSVKVSFEFASSVTVEEQEAIIEALKKVAHEIRVSSNKTQAPGARRPDVLAYRRIRVVRDNA